MTIPALIWSNTYAVLDTVNWRISMNGGEFRLIGHITFASIFFFRGVSTLTIGFSKERSQRVAVSGNTPFGAPRVEREWVRYILPYTGLPRSDCRAPDEISKTTLAQA